jgi:hypothetical protein
MSPFLKFFQGPRKTFLQVSAADNTASAAAATAEQYHCT